MPVMRCTCCCWADAVLFAATGGLRVANAAIRANFPCGPLMIEGAVRLNNFGQIVAAENAGPSLSPSAVISGARGSSSTAAGLSA